jgi:ribosomal protein S18 acetylase RimI-like enzyme
MAAQLSHIAHIAGAGDPQPVAPLSQRLWDLSFERLLPWQLDESVFVEFGTFDRALPFMQEHYGEIFGAGESGFLVEPMTEPKRRFCAEMDVFVFRAESETVGVILGHPTDWSSYYLRSAAFVRDYRGRGLMQRFAEHCWPLLREAGVDRIEAEVSTSNAPLLALQIKDGFVPTSMVTSERWGALLRMTRFLGPECKEVFRRQFSTMPLRTVEFDPKKNRSRS